MKRWLPALCVAPLPTLSTAASADPWLEAQPAFADYDDLRVLSLLGVTAVSGHLRAQIERKSQSPVAFQSPSKIVVDSGNFFAMCAVTS
ncbi:MAG TPA: hypothetical protein VFI62_04300 [Burkholderiales bacterium]|nr:hypothetical protein [Burkholderiales bacterium]